jgi:Zn-dependent M28 family amino/carboxypeptidase
MKYLVFFSVLIFSIQFAQSQNIETGKKVIQYLADDKLEGRAPGTKGGKMAREYIDQWFYDHWLGKFSFGYQQEFDISTDLKIDKSTVLSIDGVNAVLNEDFTPLVFSAEGTNDAQMVYGGTHLTRKSMDFEGKWVFVYLSDDDDEKPSFRTIINEVMTAREHKASGIILASQQDMTPNGEFYPFKFSRAVVSLDIPVMQISRDFLQRLLVTKDLSLKKLRKMSVEKVNKKIGAFSIKSNVKFEHINKTTANVAGFIEGYESNEWIVVGAHYDHLGYGGYGSGSRVPDETAIHNGADDNASGVGMVLMMAEYYKKNSPKSNMAFVLFGGEEMGLLGSKYFVDNLPFPKEKIKAMVNYDMVGRVKDSVLKIIGVNTAEEFKPLLGQWQRDPLNLSLGKGGYSGSDQAPFYAENIPVLFFNSGLHDDYHKPTDDVEKINYEGMKWVGDLSVRLLDSLTSPSFNLSFQKGEERKEGQYRTTMKVKMGIMPDVAGAVKNGLGVDGVTAEGPADKAGITKGDVIIKMGENKVSNIYDYMHQLKKLEKGQELKVIVKRDGKEVEIKVQF